MSKAALTNKLKRIEIDIDKLRLLEVNDIADLDNFMKYHSAERLIEKIVDAAVGINQMILREKFSNPIKTSKETFTDLAGFGVLTADFANEISKSVGLRNKIIHEYDQVDAETFFHSIGLCQKQYKEYLRQLINWIDKNY